MQSHANKYRFRPTMEELEERCVLSTVAAAPIAAPPPSSNMATVLATPIEPSIGGAGFRPTRDAFASFGGNVNGSTQANGGSSDFNQSLGALGNRANGLPNGPADVAGIAAASAFFSTSQPSIATTIDRTNTSALDLSRADMYLSSAHANSIFPLPGVNLTVLQSLPQAGSRFSSVASDPYEGRNLNTTPLETQSPHLFG